MYETIFYSLIVIFFNFLFEYNIFIKMMTLDSLISAINFIRIYINKNLSDSQIVNKSNSLYAGTLLDRYIYYSIVYILYKIICVFLWRGDIYILNFLSTATIIPYLLNNILISKIFAIIREKKEMFVKIIISKICAITIKWYSKMYLDKEIKIA